MIISFVSCASDNGRFFYSVRNDIFSCVLPFTSPFGFFLFIGVGVFVGALSIHDGQFFSAHIYISFFLR